MEQFSDFNVYTVVAIAALAVIALVLVIRSLVRGKSSELTLPAAPPPEPVVSPPEKDATAQRSRSAHSGEAPLDESLPSKSPKSTLPADSPTDSPTDSDAPHVERALADSTAVAAKDATTIKTIDSTKNKIERATEHAVERATESAANKTTETTAAQVEKKQADSASAAVFTQPIVLPTPTDSAIPIGSHASVPTAKPSVAKPPVPAALNIPSFAERLQPPVPKLGPTKPLTPVTRTAPAQPTPPAVPARDTSKREPSVEKSLQKPLQKPHDLPRPSPTRKDREIREVREDHKNRDNKAPAATPALKVQTPPRDLLHRAAVEQPEPSPTPVPQPPSQPISQPPSQPISQPTSQPISQPTSQPISQPTSQPISQPTSQPISQPASQPISQPTSQPISRPDAPVKQRESAPSATKPKLDRDAILAKYGIRRTEDPKTASLESTDARHREARRLARLFASEIVLYNADGIETGKKNKALYRHLKKDIDRCLQVFKTRVDADVRTKFDYLYDEIVKQVADGDEAALGPEMPPPEAPRTPSN